MTSSVVLVSVVTAFWIGVRRGTFVVGGSDSYGYVSQAQLIAGGSLRIEQSFVRTLPWPFADWTFAPPGYRPAIEPGYIVPTYPPGLPLVMAVFGRAAGRGAAFYVVPLMGALCVWATARLGARLHSPLTGAIAGVLLLSSPIFLIQVMQPLSDVPATGWWALSLVLVLEGTPLSVLGAGLAASIGILTRPNLAPLAAVPGAFLLWRAIAGQRSLRAAARKGLALFTAGTATAGVAVAAWNAHLYGSPLRSGYGELSALYAWSNLGANLDLYPRWLLEVETPFVYLALLTPLFARRDGSRGVEALLRADACWMLMAFSAVVLLSYLFYMPFGQGEWTYLRYLLPAYPVLLTLSVAASLEAARRVGIRRAVLLATAVALSAALVGWRVRDAAARGAFAVAKGEARYVAVGQYVGYALPARSLFIAGIHAGSIRYYSGRLTMRYDWLSENWLDMALEALRERGHHPLIVVEESEEAGFRSKFAVRSPVARLDWPPVAQLSEPVRVRIYDPADRDRFLAGDPVWTAPIPATSRR